MPKAQKFTAVQKFLIVSVVLIAIQALYLLIFAQKKKPVSFMEQVSRSIDKIPGMAPEDRVIAKVEMAIRNFQETSQGQLPQSLNQLVPKYFDEVPVDPSTNQPLKYAVSEGGSYTLGEPKVQVAGASGAQASSATQGDPLTQDQADQLLLASVMNKTEEPAFVYDPTGKRDPFQPFDLSPKRIDDDSKTPLERYDIGQLKLTAVLGGMEEHPTAIVELAGGRGYTVKKGTKIGVNGGEVVEIRPDKLLILETTVDFTGEKKTQTIELPLRNKASENRN